jgi:hypothetical protein
VTIERHSDEPEKLVGQITAIQYRLDFMGIHDRSRPFSGRSLDEHRFC